MQRMSRMEDNVARQAQQSGEIAGELHNLQTTVKHHAEGTQQTVADIKRTQASADEKLDAAMTRIEALLEKRFKTEH